MKNNLGNVWHNCVLVRKSGKDIEYYESKETTKTILKRLNDYKSQNPNYDDDDGSVWYDLKNGFCFGSAQYKKWRGTDSLPSKDHSYFCNQKTFPAWSENFIRKAFRDNQVFSNEKIVSSSDYYFGMPDTLNKFKDKKIIIVGGGPSANAVNWDNIEYDYLWSINKFYLNDKLKNKKVDLATVASHIDILEEKELHEYIEENNTIISFELERGNVDGEYQKYIELAEFADKYPNQSTFFHTRYKSQPGVGMRMICYAIMLGCKEVYFVGVDGFTQKGPLHSFEKDKENPNWYVRFGEELQKRQFITFWDYLVKLRSKYDYNIYNLGEGFEYNVSSEITKQISPLPKEVKESIRL
jgi:hypothetical protein